MKICKWDWVTIARYTHLNVVVGQSSSFWVPEWGSKVQRSPMEFAQELNPVSNSSVALREEKSISICFTNVLDTWNTGLVWFLNKTFCLKSTDTGKRLSTLSRLTAPSWIIQQFFHKGTECTPALLGRSSWRACIGAAFPKGCWVSGTFPLSYRGQFPITPEHSTWSRVVPLHLFIVPEHTHTHTHASRKTHWMMLNPGLMKTLSSKVVWSKRLSTRKCRRSQTDLET